MSGRITLHRVLIGALLALLVLVPLYVTSSGNMFVMTLFTRVIILAMAAVSPRETMTAAA